MGFVVEKVFNSHTWSFEEQMVWKRTKEDDFEDIIIQYLVDRDIRPTERMVRPLRELASILYDKGYEDGLDDGEEYGRENAWDDPPEPMRNEAFD